VQAFLVAGIADASDLRATDNGQQVEFVEGAGGFRKGTSAIVCANRAHSASSRQAKILARRNSSEVNMKPASKSAQIIVKLLYHRTPSRTGPTRLGARPRTPLQIS
jgi:hypothetical protein